MMMSEFNEMLGRDVKDIDWDAIEMVYMWHPSFDRTDAKKVAVEIYHLLGVRPFLEMYNTAIKAKDLEEQLQRYKANYEQAKVVLAEFKESNR